MDKDDIIQSARVGLLKAIKSYNPEKGVRFETYARPRIDRAIKDEMREFDFMFIKLRQKAKRYAEAEFDIMAEVSDGTSPTDEQMAQRLGVNANEFIKFFQAYRFSRTKELDGLIERDGAVKKWDIEDKKAVNPYSGIEEKDLINFVLADLNRDEKLILLLYRVNGLTFRESMNAVGLSEHRVWCILRKGVKKVRRRFGEGSPESQHLETIRTA